MFAAFPARRDLPWAKLSLSHSFLDGDDTPLVMSFINFKAKLRNFGLNTGPVCDGKC